MENLNSFILQQVIKKRSSHEEGTIQDLKKQKIHFQKLVQNINSLSDGQATLSYNDEDFRKFSVYVTPNGGPYEGGNVRFNFKMKPSYPSTPPQITCQNTIYHPNIDDEGDICLSVLNEWSSDNNDLVDCIQGLLYLLHNPNLEDPLSPYFAPGEDEVEFLEIVKLTLAGGVFNEVQFDCLLPK